MTLPDQTGSNQRQLVLDNNAPPHNRPARLHAGPGPNLTTDARVAIPTASTASANTLPVDTGGSDPGANASAQAVKNAAITAALNRNRRNQPRTVDAGTPNRAAIGR